MENHGDGTIRAQRPSSHSTRWIDAWLVILGQWLQTHSDSYNRVIGAVAAVLGAISLVIALQSPSAAMGLAIFWAIFPPVVFWIDYFYVVPRHERQEAIQSIQVKAGIWFGVGASLFAIAGTAP